jgi:hypothetical protein
MVDEKNAGEDQDVAAYGYNEESLSSQHEGQPQQHAHLDHMGTSRRRLNVTSEAVPVDLVNFRPSRLLFYAPPRQRQKWGDTQVLPRVNWGDLFFDLFYVAATYNVSNIVVNAPNRQGLLYAAGTFLPVMGIWNQKTFYDSRYAVEGDVVHRFLEVFIMGVLGVAMSHIRSVSTLSNAAGDPSIFVFSLMMVIDKFFAMTLYLEVYFQGVGQKQLKHAAMRDLGFNFIGMFFYSAAMIVSAIEYFGKGDGSVLRGRLLADATAKYDNGVTETTDLPIYLCLFGHLAWAFWFFSHIVFCLPGGGRHKEL